MSGIAIAVGVPCSCQARLSCSASHKPCATHILLQVKAQYDSLLEEMAAASRKRERWLEQQAAAERELAEEREHFEAFTRKQVGSTRAGCGR